MGYRFHNGTNSRQVYVDVCKEYLTLVNVIRYPNSFKLPPTTDTSEVKSTFSERYLSHILGTEI